MCRALLLLLCLARWSLAHQHVIKCGIDENMNKELNACVKSLAHKLTSEQEPAESSINVTSITPRTSEIKQNTSTTICNTLDDLKSVGEKNNMAQKICSKVFDNHNENIQGFVKYFHVVFSEKKINEFLSVHKHCLWQAKPGIDKCVKNTLKSDENATFGLFMKPLFGNVTCFETRSILVMQSCVADTLKACPNDTQRYVDSIFEEALSTCQDVIRSSPQSLSQPFTPEPEDKMSLAVKMVLIIISIIAFVALVFYLARWYRLRSRAQSN